LCQGRLLMEPMHKRRMILIGYQGLYVGRKRAINQNLPYRMHAVTKPNGVKYYYYDTGAKPRYLPLGSNYVDAMRKWADHEQGKSASIIVTFKDVWDSYAKDKEEGLLARAPRTQVDYLNWSKRLMEFFGDANFQQIQPLHIKQYKNWRTAKVQCNREIALFSLLWNYAREKGVTDRINPCAGVKRNKEVGRDVYISDAEYIATMGKAEPVLRDAMELAYLMGQRPADVLKLRENNINDGCIEFRQGKTDKPMRIEISPSIQAVIDRCKARKNGKVYNTALVTGVMGKPVTVRWISALWKRAKDAAGITRDIQFRDLRAKAVSDKEEVSDIREAQALAGHSTVAMTEHYSRKRRGMKVTPTK
jgi:integrase